ncbi:MAG: hypothetical protein M3Y82_14905, partial [Verrucomicrobiota bacterium]|nr:hypothetical protein [Verrucomicrobiota bacterium]
MKKLLTTLGVLVFFSFIEFVQAQPQFIWANRIGGSGSERGYAVAADDDGNCYVTGKFENSCSFGNIILTSQGASDV